MIKFNRVICSSEADFCLRETDCPYNDDDDNNNNLDDVRKRVYFNMRKLNFKGFQRVRFHQPLFIFIVSDGDTIDSFLTWSCSLAYNNFVHLTRYVCRYEWEGCWCWTCVLPEEDSGGTGEKQITDLDFSIWISKSVIYFSPVTPESSSGVTRSNNWKKINR